MEKYRIRCLILLDNCDEQASYHRHPEIDLVDIFVNNDKCVPFLV